MSVENWKLMKSAIESSDRDFTTKEITTVLQEKMPEIQKIADDTIDILKDGWQFSDVVDFFKVIGPLLDLVEDISEWDEDKKEDFVVAAMYFIYQTIDTYPDGKQNNINIPFLFGGIERKFEERALEFATRSAIRALCGYFDKKD